jgi:hypothetical protein
MVQAYVRQVVEVIVQMRRVDGQRRVSEILFRSGGLGDRLNGGGDSAA